MTSPSGRGERFYEALVEDDPEDLYENAPCAYLSTAPDGTIVKVNGTFLEWTGYEREALLGRRRFQELLAPGDRIFYETHFAPSLRMQGQVREIAVELVGESGGRLPVLVNSVLKVDAAGQPLAVRTVLFDASERRSYEAELLAARQRAEASEARAVALARTLQASFLPPALVEIPGLDIGAAYRPAGDGTDVGGDFYDVFETAHGSWAFVLGDVCGKGADAAVLTALARYTIRAEVMRAQGPAEVLAAVHGTMLRYHPDQYCTAAMLEVDVHPSGAGALVSVGGHHRPLRRRPDGSFDRLGHTGTILGLVETPGVTESEELLDPGDIVVLYTDGVTEARRDGVFFDDARLYTVIDDVVSASAQGIADAIVSIAVDFQDGSTRDDIAVLVIKVP